MAKKPFYSKTPVVPEKQIAGKNPIPGPALGEFAPPMAPMHPGRTKALGPAKVKISAERLRSILDYDPMTGIFRWKITKVGCGKGKKAGSPSGGDKNNRGHYLIIGIEGKKYYVHHLAWLYVYGEYVDRLDHKDRNGHNNAIDNLRPASVIQNAANSNARRNNKTTGVKGVRKRKHVYQARIGVGGKEINLGHYPTIEAAQEAYLNELKRRYGDFAGA